MRLTSGENTTDPLTDIPVVLGQVRMTMDGRIRVTQTTGEPPYGTNQEPGTSSLPPGGDDPGLPRGFEEVPKTGPLS